MKPTVYLETTIISYLTANISRDIIIAGRQQTTKLWWDSEKSNYKLLISEAVQREAEKGDFHAARKRLELLKSIQSLDITDEATRLANQFLSRGCIPKPASIDALHVAIAAVNSVQFLLTWNCAHIANATIRVNLEREAALTGFNLPVICTPDELLGGKHGIV